MANIIKTIGCKYSKQYNISFSFTQFEVTVSGPTKVLSNTVNIFTVPNTYTYTVSATNAQVIIETHDSEDTEIKVYDVTGNVTLTITATAKQTRSIYLQGAYFTDQGNYYGY